MLLGEVVVALVQTVLSAIAKVCTVGTANTVGANTDEVVVVVVAIWGTQLHSA